MITPNPLFTIKAIDLSDDTQINAGASRTEALQPPPGQIYELISLNSYAVDPVGSTTGSLDLKCYMDYDDLAISIFRADADTGSNGQINYSNFKATSEEPSSGNQIEAMRSVFASYDHPVGFKWDNTTDANMTTNRTLKVMVKVYSELIL